MHLLRQLTQRLLTRGHPAGIPGANCVTAVKHAVPALLCYTDCELTGGSVMYDLKVSLVASGGLSLPGGATTLAMPRRTRGQVRNLLLPALFSLAALLVLPGWLHAQSVLTDDAHTSTAPKTVDSNFGTNP